MNDSFHYVGVGVGPANLSLAALAAGARGRPARFYESAPEFAWHPGLLFDESLLQTSYLKDLVTPVDPTSPHSFLAYLVAHRQFYSFLTADFPRVSRAEFSRYLAWVARSLPALRFGCPVLDVRLEGEGFRVETEREAVRARHLVLGTGRRPKVPACARPHLGGAVFHASRYRSLAPDLRGKRVAVVGGGQSGAEIVHHALLDSNALPERLFWVGRRDNFYPLDDSPFANEWFTPEYSEHFRRLEPERKAELVSRQTLASDGVSMGLLQDIYRRLYALRFVERRDPRGVRLLADHSLDGLRPSTRGGFALELCSAAGRRRAEEVDVVVLATGYGWELPACLEPLRPRLRFAGGEPELGDDFSIAWDGPPGARIYAQNAARAQRGVADPNLSLLAWRSARILNALEGRPVYDCAPAESIVDWDDQAEVPSTLRRAAPTDAPASARRAPPVEAYADAELSAAFSRRGGALARRREAWRSRVAVRHGARASS
jgi:lysine N6-hydroxylase